MSEAYFKKRFDKDYTEGCRYAKRPNFGFNTTCVVLKQARDFLTHKALHGCVVKQLNAIPCSREDGGPRPLAREAFRADADMDALVPRAMDALQEFFFVGIRERWDQTVFAFHAATGTRPAAAEFVRARSRAPDAEP